MTGDPLRGGDPLAPACRCGLRIQPRTTVYGVDDGACQRHPGKKMTTERVVVNAKTKRDAN